MKICIDAGHNDSGFDTGANGNGLREQDISFSIAFKLKVLFELFGYIVIMTRPSKTTNLGNSVNTSINKRIQLCNSSECDLFLSIHCNAGGGTGTETLIYKKGGYAELLATFVQNEIVTKLGTVSRGIKERNIGVLKATNCPAILVETAFIDTKKDSVLLINNQDNFAQAIYSGVLKYLGENVVQEQAIESIPETIYKTVGTTQVIEIDPRNIFAVETQKATYNTPYNNFVNSIFFQTQANGIMYANGIMVNAGQVISNFATHNLPVSTLIIRGKNDVIMKPVSDITKEKNVWFAVSGYGIYPYVTAKEEGFIGRFSDVLRETNRPIIGYRKSDNKVVIAVRAKTSAERAKQTAQNLNLDFAISLDAGGSTTLKINNKYIFRGDGRQLFGGLIWN